LGCFRDGPVLSDYVFICIPFKIFDAMSDKKYDSELIGWVDEPVYNEQGELISWSIKLKDHELKDIMDNYVTPRDDKGQGGNARIKLFMSKNGKACGSVYNFNSEAAKERRAAAMARQNEQSDGDLPF